MTGQDVSEDLALMGLSRWKGTVGDEPRKAGRKVAVLYGYDPGRRRPRIVTRYGCDRADALARAVAAVQRRPS